jgi:multiple sugar transport system ATP-binding protein
MGNNVASIELKGVTKHFGETVVIPGLDLQVQDGEFMVFVGPSGCGKSTMLRMIAGLEAMTSGSIHIGDENVSDKGPSERGAAMVFQSYALYPHMTVEDNMGFGLRMSGTSKTETAKLVQDTAERLQLSPLLKRYPKQLSGGQRQRVAIGRAIVRRPKVFLFDEPLSNLDASLRVQMRIELAKLHADLQTTMVYVTHDQTEAMTLGNRIAVFNQGRIEQVGAPVELYQKPVNRFVAEFLGSPKVNLLGYIWDAQHQLIRISPSLALPPTLFRADPARLAQGAFLGLRPEHCVLSSHHTGFAATIEFMEYLGDSVLAYLQLSGAKELFKLKINQSNSPLKVGQFVHIDYVHGELMVFGADGRAV